MDKIKYLGGRVTLTQPMAMCARTNISVTYRKPKANSRGPRLLNTISVENGIAILTQKENPAPEM